MNITITPQKMSEGNSKSSADFLNSLDKETNRNLSIQPNGSLTDITME